MNLPTNIRNIYCKEQKRAFEAQRHAQEIAFAPVAFQVSRLMIKFGILSYISEFANGATYQEIVKHTGLSQYAVKVLLEASLSVGTVYIDSDRFRITKTGWYLLNDPMTKANMEFNHDVNYLGLFYLEESLLKGRPEGLKVFGQWGTIYEGLSSLPEHVQKSWFGFDHFYSDNSFDDALGIIFNKENRKVKTLLDVGGNTGRWAMKCVSYDTDVEVTILDLPQQIGMMRENINGKDGSDRIKAYPCNILDANSVFPSKSFDIIWMSQFLDCFSPQEITDICKKATISMDENSRLYIMETFWDRQKFETASYCLTLTSIYFTAMANGNSKMYHSDDMKACVNDAGLEIEEIIDGLGWGHSIMICKKSNV